jgi:hypothetical protein
MSILAADRLAIAGRPAAAALDMAVHAGVGSIVQDYQKITLNSNGTLALGIAGQTQEHYPKYRSYPTPARAGGGVGRTVCRVIRSQM